jgi:hypothetical protein
MELLVRFSTNPYSGSKKQDHEVGTGLHSKKCRPQDCPLTCVLSSQFAIFQLKV